MVRRHAIPAPFLAVCLLSFVGLRPGPVLGSSATSGVVVDPARATAACPFDGRAATPPVRGRVVARFAAPVCERCAGRRGMLVETEPGAAVVATSSGPVTFAGQVGGALWVVQEVAPGVRVTYGRLAVVAAGATTGVRLRSGEGLGTSSGRVHLGVRVGSRYVDPAPCWRGTPRLVPTVGVERGTNRR